MTVMNSNVFAVRMRVWIAILLLVALGVSTQP